MWASLVAQLVKNLPAVKETQVWSLHWEDLLEKEMATHSSILAWKISWTEEPGGLQSTGLQRVGHDWAINTYLQDVILSWNWIHRKLASNQVKFRYSFPKGKTSPKISGTLLTHTSLWDQWIILTVAISGAHPYEGAQKKKMYFLKKDSQRSNDSYR